MVPSDQFQLHTLYERVAVLEVQNAETMKSLVGIEAKLDELLQLKAKGMGALWLIGLIAGSGLLGIVAALASFFNKGHLP